MCQVSRPTRSRSWANVDRAPFPFQSPSRPGPSVGLRNGRQREYRRGGSRASSSDVRPSIGGNYQASIRSSCLSGPVDPEPMHTVPRLNGSGWAPGMRGLSTWFEVCGADSRFRLGNCFSVELTSRVAVQNTPEQTLDPECRREAWRPGEPR